MVTMGAGIGVVLLIVVVLLGLREQSLYTTQRDGLWKDGTDLFVYSKGRFVVRLMGLAMTMVLGVALFCWDLWPPLTPSSLATYVVVFGVSSIGLVVIVVLDLVITARTAKPENLKRQGDLDRQTNKPTRLPRSE